MPISRRFLNWQKPALEAAADFLCQEYAHADPIAARLPLNDVIVGVPGSRAGRRLLEILVARCEQQSVTLVPPTITTVGKIPELLYRPRLPFANELIQRLAWTRALRQHDAAELRTVLPFPPDADATIDWLQFGDVIGRQHRELAGNRIDFKDLAAQTWNATERSEQVRWQLLTNIQRAYLDILDKLGLWDLQTARLEAIKRRECRLDRHLVLIGATDMSLTLREMLDQVADRVTALVFAPASWSERFDLHGCVDPEYWSTARIPIDEDQVRVVDGPAEQARMVVETVGNLAATYQADEMTIGVPNDTLIPYLQRQLSSAGLRARWVVGRPIRESSIFRLLQAVADYLDEPRFSPLADLVRHPAIYSWLHEHGLQGDCLSSMDTYYVEHLPARVGNWHGERENAMVMRRVHECIEELLQDMAVASKRLTEWPRVIQEFLRSVFKQTEMDRSTNEGNEFQVVCHRLQEILNEQAEVPLDLAPMISGADAIRLVLDELSADNVAPLADDQAIELLGWLELPLDDAPAAILTGLNEGTIPEATNSDLFLPNALRRRLGLLDNSRRYARDAYALSSLLLSRKSLTLIVGRRNAAKDPLIPSRLLIAADHATIARRVKKWFSAPEPLPPYMPHDSGVSVDFAVPFPVRCLEPVKRLSVTAFRSYLACPYRFYLRHILGLQALDDVAQELDAGQFGTTIHTVLGKFGECDVRGSTNPESIQDFLDTTLDKVIQDQFGSDFMPAVRMQVAQMRLRLKAFAEWQAKWANQGWRIHATEAGSRKAAYEMAVDDQTLMIDGRIDRIDYHAERNSWMILDYKTGDSFQTPEKAHWAGTRWIDLQLPLYRKLALAMGIAQNVGLGYITLPKDLSQVGLAEASWTEEMLENAYATAVDVARRILNQEFWPPTMPPPALFAEFGVILQEGTMAPNLTTHEQELP